MNDPSNPNFWQDAFLSASRAGLAGGTLGAGEIVFGTYRAISRRRRRGDGNKNKNKNKNKKFAPFWGEALNFQLSAQQFG